MGDSAETLKTGAVLFFPIPLFKNQYQAKPDAVKLPGHALFLDGNLPRINTRPCVQIF